MNEQARTRSRMIDSRYNAYFYWIEIKILEVKYFNYWLPVKEQIFEVMNVCI